METALYIYAGGLYNRTTRGEVNRPTVLVDPDMDTFHGWGEYDNITKKCEQLNNAGFDTCAIELTQLPKPIAAYIILRMMNYTASGFVKNFCARSETPNSAKWLASEIARVPIDIPDKPND